jgi:mono/diheme cytochrome c family protein
MVANLFGVLVLVAAVGLLGWLTWRAARSRRAALKWAGTPAAALLTFVFAIVTVVAVIGLVKVYGPRGNSVPDFAVAGTAEQITRGEYIASFACAGCHGREPEWDLPLVGGADVAAEIGMPIGTVIIANLTPAGRIDDWTDGELARAIREGVDPDGRVLPIMAMMPFENLSKEDLASVIAYVRSQPAAGEATPSTRLSLLGVTLIGAGAFPIRSTPDADYWIDAPPRAATVEYGKYLVDFNECHLCHGEALTGEPATFLAPPGADLRIVKGWSEDEFKNTLRTGITPYGMTLDDEMPWDVYARMDDVELKAIWRYLQTIGSDES